MLSKILYILLIFFAFCVSVNAEDKSAERLVELEEKLTITSFNLRNYRIGSAYRLAAEVSRNFTSSELSRVSIDNYNGNFIVESIAASSYIRAKDWTNVVVHGEKALQFRTDNGVGSAPNRFSRLLMCLARAYNSKSFRNYSLADEYQHWALEIDPDNAQLQQKMALEEFFDTLRDKNYEKGEAILRDTIQRNGLPKRMVYKVFGTFLWRQKKRKDCFSLWLNALKDMRLDYHENSRELGIENIKKTIAYADEDQLYEYEALLKTLPARYPAIIKYAPAIAGLLRTANDPELQDEIFLRKAEKEFTSKMEKKLLKFIKTKKHKVTRAYLYLGDNLLARGFGNEAIDIWFEAFKKYGSHRFSKGKKDWFSDRISANFNAATPEQIEKYMDLIASLREKTKIEHLKK